MENLCLSGGAEGADLMWGMTAGEAGHTVIHFTFEGHRTRAPQSEIAVLTDKQLDVADEHCKRASETLNRYFPPRNKFVKNLLRRNYYQIFESERVYAVTTFDRGIVQGGTAWAVQMFLDRFDSEPCECYIFDQVAEQWFVWEGYWKAIEAPPKPHGIWAGVGSRNLLEAGKKAIRGLMEWKAEEACSGRGG